ncbi:4-coumarate--CoA ligase-like 6 [Dionaea muscipula]
MINFGLSGYLNDRQATMIAINEDGWLCTGDIGYFDDQGYVHIVDRLKDIIKYKGFQIAPADLEAILLTHPDILDAAIVGAVDEEVGEVPTAFLVKKPGSMLSGDAVIQYVTKQVAPYKKVRKAVFSRLDTKICSRKGPSKTIEKSIEFQTMTSLENSGVFFFAETVAGTTILELYYI